ncbi:hypothetical protein ACLOJK_011059 [Asimina triloba]
MATETREKEALDLNLEKSTEAGRRSSSSSSDSSLSSSEAEEDRKSSSGGGNAPSPAPEAGVAEPASGSVAEQETELPCEREVDVGVSSEVVAFEKTNGGNSGEAVVDKDLRIFSEAKVLAVTAMVGKDSDEIDSGRNDEISAGSNHINGRILFDHHTTDQQALPILGLSFSSLERRTWYTCLLPIYLDQERGEDALAEAICATFLEEKMDKCCCMPHQLVQTQSHVLIFSPQGNMEWPVDRSLPRANTLPGERAKADQAESSMSQQNLERSQTERRRHNNILGDEATQIFDDKISARKKLKMLNRIATVKDDGTVVFDLPTSVESGSLLGTEDVYAEVVDEEPLDPTDMNIPPLQIAMLIVGTRGDVQPFVAIGKRLQDYGHRVRLATHSNFKEFVLTAGLEFYPIGGDPKILAEYMVKNKGFLPSGPSEIPIQRKQMKEIIYSLLSACRDSDVDSGIPFKAEAIIANPPAYESIVMGCRYSVDRPTSEFPHPLSRVKQPAGYRVSKFHPS